MTNIRVKQESLFDWRSSLKESSECQCEGCGQDPCVECGYNCHDVNEGIVDSILTKINFVKHAKDTVKKYNDKLRKNADAINEIIPGTAKVSEELQGGVSVEPYTKDTKFLEVETVDIIKPKPLVGEGKKQDLLYRPETDKDGNIIPPKKTDLLYRPKTDKDGNIIPPKLVPMSDHYDWRSEFQDQVDERYKFLKGGNRKNLAEPKNKNIKHNVTGVDYTLMVKNDKKKEVVSASFEADLENLIIEILEHDINELHKNGFTYQEVAEFYEIEQDLSEGWGNVLWQGGKFLATKVAPTVLKATGNYIKRRSVKDVRKVVQFARNPKNWARANKDIDKVGRFVGELPARTYAGIQAVNQKLIQPAKNIVGNIKGAKRGGDLAVIRQQIKGNIATNNPRILSAADKFTKSKTNIKAPNWDATVPAVRSTASTTSTKRLTSSRPHLDHPTSKGLTYQQKQSKATNIIANIKRKTPKQIEADKILARMKNAIDKSKKPGTYSANVNAAKKISDPGALVKTKGSSITKTPSTSITKTPPSSLTRKTPSGATKTPPSGTTRTTPSGSSYSPRNMINVTPNPAATVTKVAAGTAAAAVIGKNLGSKEGSAENETTKTDTKTTNTKTTDTKTTDTKTTETPKSITPKNDKENKTISNTEKKTVDPKKNEIVTKDSSSTDDGGKAAWLHKTRNSPAARSGAFTDDERWNTQLKHRAWKASRQRKKVNEAAIAIPIGIGLGKTALKLGGTVLAAKGGEEILKRLLQGKDRQDYDWEKKPKDDVDRELNTRQRQAKDSAKNRPHDRDIEAYRKTIDPKTGKTTLSPEDQIKVIKNAAAKHPSLKKVNKKLNKDKK